MPQTLDHRCGGSAEAVTRSRKEALAQNIRAFVGAVAKVKPSGAKGTYLKKIAVSSTMGLGVSVAVDSATGA